MNVLWTRCLHSKMPIESPLCIFRYTLYHLISQLNDNFSFNEKPHMNGGWNKLYDRFRMYKCRLCNDSRMHYRIDDFFLSKRQLTNDNLYHEEIYLILIVIYVFVNFFFHALGMTLHNKREYKYSGYWCKFKSVGWKSFGIAHTEVSRLRLVSEHEICNNSHLYKNTIVWMFLVYRIYSFRPWSFRYLTSIEAKWDKKVYCLVGIKINK